MGYGSWNTCGYQVESTIFLTRYAFVSDATNLLEINTNLV